VLRFIRNTFDSTESRYGTLAGNSGHDNEPYGTLAGNSGHDNEPYGITGQV
jgi:hypothetical protein